jgi:hypothetical protein
LKPGGRLYFSVWDRIEENTCAQVFADTIERLFPGDAEIRFTLPWSMHDQAVLRKLVEDASFELVRIDKKRLPIVGDARTIATGQVRGTPRGALLEQRGLTMDEAIDRVTVALDKAGPVHGQALVIEARA